ncbi:MAG: hypothetical protein ACLQVI_11740 [Polyangiaceae bacterium]
MRRTLIGRKLLVASIGVASVSYAACSTNPSFVGPDGAVGNLGPGDSAASEDAFDVVVGNLGSDSGGLSPPDASSAESPDAADAGNTDAAADGAPVDAGDAAQADAGDGAPADAAEEG